MTVSRGAEENRKVEMDMTGGAGSDLSVRFTHV